jgi:hypothetical protein
MRYSVVAGLVFALAAAGCCCHRSTCREPCAGTAAVTGPAPQAYAEPSNPTDTEPSYQTHRSYPTQRRSQDIPAAPGGKTYGHAEDYSWLIGRLQRISTPNDQWKIRYAPIDEEDQWGGSMVLAPDARLAKYTDGDVVYLEGQIIAPRPSLYVTGPLYRLRMIRSFGASLSAVERESVPE